MSSKLTAFAFVLLVVADSIASGGVDAQNVQIVDNVKNVNIEGLNNPCYYEQYNDEGGPAPRLKQMSVLVSTGIFSVRLQWSQRLRLPGGMQM